MTAIDDWLAASEHPLADAARVLVERVRLAAPASVESIKWQAPSFALADDFATFSLRRPTAVQVVMHTGAVPKPEHPEIVVGDLGGRARRADRNRVVVTFGSADDVAAAADDFQALVVAWVAQLR